MSTSASSAEEVSTASTQMHNSQPQEANGTSGSTRIGQSQAKAKVQPTAARGGCSRVRFLKCALKGATLGRRMAMKALVEEAIQHWGRTARVIKGTLAKMQVASADLCPMDPTNSQRKRDSAEAGEESDILDHLETDSSRHPKDTTSQEPEAGAESYLNGFGRSTKSLRASCACYGVGQNHCFGV